MQAGDQNTNHPNPPPPPHHRHHIVYHQQIMEQSPAADSTTAIAGSWEHLSSAASANDELGLREESIVFIWQKLAQMPMAQGAFPLAPVYRDRFLTKKCRISAFVQGNLDALEGKTIFLTVHDIGKSHLSFARFVANNQAMAPLREKAIFVHVCVPGQQPGAADMGEDFPTMDNLGEALAQLMGKLNLSKCVAVGEGAGADIVCRFAMNYHQMVQGIVLIHCTSTTHGILEQIKEIFMNLRLDDGLMGSASWNYLLTHRFGNHNLDQEQKHFLDRLRAERLNEGNLSRYIYSFAHRDDFTSELGRSLAKVDAILVTGGRSGHNENVQHMFQHMNKSKTAMLVAQDCVDVLEQAPEYVVCALLLLCQRKGLLSDLQLPVLKTTADYSTPAAPDALTCSGAVASHEKPANTNQMFTA